MGCAQRFASRGPAVPRPPRRVLFVSSHAETSSLWYVAETHTHERQTDAHRTPLPPTLHEDRCSCIFPAGTAPHSTRPVQACEISKYLKMILSRFNLRTVAAMDPQLAAIMEKRKKQSDEDAQDGFESQSRTSPRATPPARAPAVSSTPPKRQPPTLPPTLNDSRVHPHRARAFEASAGQEAARVLPAAQPEADPGGIAEAGRQGPRGGEQGAQAKQAGVGMTLTERHPFKVVYLRPGGPAASAGQIQEGDELTCVQGEVLGPNVSGAQVCLHGSTHAWRHTHTAHPPI